MLPPVTGAYLKGYEEYIEWTELRFDINCKLLSPIHTYKTDTRQEGKHKIFPNPYRLMLHIFVLR